MTTESLRMPVLVEVPVNHETFRPISDRLRERLDVAKSIEELAADSERNTQRSHRLREAHLEAVKERAERETKRAEEAAARRRRAAAEDARKIVEKMEAASAKMDAKKEEQAKKREMEKERRSALARAASEARRAQENDMAKRSAENLLRTDRAQHARNARIGAVVEKSGGQVKHALSVAARLSAERGTSTSRSEPNSSQATDCEETPVSPAPSPASCHTPRAVPPTLTMELGGAKGGDTPRGLTPRQSPRRAPEMPTIMEDDIAEELEEDPVEVSEVLPTVYGPVTTVVNETLSALQGLSETSANAFNSRATSSIDGQKSRSFQRRGPYKVPSQNGRSRTVYEILWDDGTSRLVYGQ